MWIQNNIIQILVHAFVAFERALMAAWRKFFFCRALYVFFYLYPGNGRFRMEYKIEEMEWASIFKHFIVKLNEYNVDGIAQTKSLYRCR
jgi:hypothetical protein